MYYGFDGATVTHRHTVTGHEGAYSYDGKWAGVYKINHDPTENVHDVYEACIDHGWQRKEAWAIVSYDKRYCQWKATIVSKSGTHTLMNPSSIVLHNLAYDKVWYTLGIPSPALTVVHRA